MFQEATENYLRHDYAYREFAKFYQSRNQNDKAEAILKKALKNAPG